jgi:hypothetical protein
MTKIFSATALTLSLLCSAAWAQIQPDEKTGSDLSAELNAYFNLLKSEESVYLVSADAPINVAVEGDGYRLGIPALKLTIAKGPKKDSGTLILPASTAYLKPMGNELYETEYTFPPKVTFTSQKVESEVTIAFGAGSYKGQWQRTASGKEAFPLSNLSLKDVKFLDKNNKELGGIGAVAVFSQLLVTPEGSLQLTGNGGLRSFSFVAANRALSLRGLDYQYNSKGGNAAQIANFETAAQKLRGEISTLDKAAPAAKKTGMVNDFMATLLPALKVDADGIFKVTATDLSYLDNGANPKVFKLAKANLGIQATTNTAGLMNLTIAPSYEGLEMNPTSSQLAADVTPKSFQLSLNAEKVPLSDLVGLGGGLANKRINSEPVDTKLTRDSLLTAMESAGTVLKITKLALMTPVLATSVDGAFAPAPNAKTGVTGEANIVIKGLDEYVNTLAERGRGQGEAAGEAQMAMMPLGMVQGIGQQQAGGGVSGRVYKIALSPAGGFTVNGVDLGALVGGMKGGGSQ